MFKKILILVLALGVIGGFNCCTCPKPELSTETVWDFCLTHTVWLDSSSFDSSGVWSADISPSRPIPIDSTIKDIKCGEVPGEVVQSGYEILQDLYHYNEWGERIVDIPKTDTIICPKGTKLRIVNPGWVLLSNPPKREYQCCKPEIKCDTTWKYIYEDSE